MTGKYTQGPWKTGSGLSNKYTIYDNFGQRIANSFEGVMATQKSDAECEANARLIAAAPENYESNKELAEIVRELCAAYNHPLPEASLQQSDTAIAKATN